MAAEVEFEINLRTRKHYLRGNNGFIERQDVIFAGFLEAAAASHLHILVIFQTSISPEPMQIFVNGKRRLKSFVEFYATNLKNQGVKI